MEESRAAFIAKQFGYPYQVKMDSNPDNLQHYEQIKHEYKDSVVRVSNFIFCTNEDDACFLKLVLG